MGRIFDFVRTWDGRSALPDEDPVVDRIGFTRGALDNVRLRHFGMPDAQTTRLFRALERAASSGTASDRTTLYRLMQQHPAVENAEALAARVAESALDREAVGEVARRLAMDSDDRAPVKYALALLAICGSPRDAELVMTFARHDEFTMYAASAAERISDDPLAVELAMAERVHGWGKIALVERIAARDSDRTDVRAWLLRRGCANDVLDEYLAYACATAGRLHEAIAAESLDDELRRGACTIVSALINGGPAESISDYEHGPFVVEQLLRHLAGTSDPGELAIVSQIAWWAAKEHPPLAEKARAILSGESVREKLRTAFRSGDRSARFHAWAAARETDLDLWEDTFAHALREPATDYLYQWLVDTHDPMRLRRAIALAEEQLPHDAIATGPANELGFGLRFQPHMSLAMILPSLAKKGQFSPRLVMTALRSPVINNRNWGLNVLEATPREKWGAEVLAVLRRAVGEEPEAKVKARMQALLS